jgi:uncharacterized protein (TIGR03083 family)
MSINSFDMLHTPSPVIVADRFPALLDSLLDLLKNLSDEQWLYPVHQGAWTVKDLAQHLIGDDVNILSGMRNGYTENLKPVMSWDELVAFINHRNEVWVEATRRMSPQLILHLLRWTGDQVNSFFLDLDPYGLSEPVSWAGPEPAPNWLVIAREFTEHWHHQQHIRDAIGKPGGTETFFLAPVLATFVRALPQTYRTIDAPDGTSVNFRITGDAGADWAVVKEEGSWRLFEGHADPSNAAVVISEDTAWRLFSKGISKDEGRRCAIFSGDLSLAEKVLENTAIIA